MNYYPIDKNGNMLTKLTDEKVGEIPCEVFESVLKFHKYVAAWHKVYVHFEDVHTKRIFIATEKAFFSMIHRMANGYLVGKFRVAKIGRGFTLVHYDDPVDVKTNTVTKTVYKTKIVKVKEKTKPKKATKPKSVVPANKRRVTVIPYKIDPRQQLAEIQKKMSFDYLKENFEEEMNDD